MQLNEQRVIAELNKKIVNTLNQAGVFFRIFGRSKSKESIKSKLDEKSPKYLRTSTKMQDYIGLRLGLYFADDQRIVNDILKRVYQLVGESVDHTESNIFGPTRWNLVFRLPNELIDEIDIYAIETLIDTTFEIQIRTILSEGWHEVEHDLRYKCQEVWSGHSDLSRALNGIYATLEMSDWAMLNIFEELAYRSYKKGDWSTMIRNKLRLHLLNYDIRPEILTQLNKSKDIGKAFYRLKREEIICKLFDLKHPVPLNANNMIFLANRLSVQDDAILALEPDPIKAIFDQVFAQETVGGESVGHS
ncbi:hypothetical protein KP005_17970 [Geomonas nitrogeniifigens]|uniref:RelA/SpoT domain-containing protein n=1 Tax=Geomonas diazotrophica TaxID=2843197 RepID=A0ABX8JFP9_9BACT|nr:hypothetical protein [Geomonas nitrogeniifigens]QWV97205.1 hypothetical protein KP005_17970 [Geomonas nitrogeniifigens]